MAGNYAQLLDIINNPTQHGLPAWDNNAKQIEGETVQQYLLTIINSLTVGYQFMGVASTDTSGGTPDQNVFYLAGAGTYNGFGSNPITINAGYIGIIRWNGAWNSDTIKIADIVSVSQNTLSIGGEKTSIKNFPFSVINLYSISTGRPQGIEAGDIYYNSQYKTFVRITEDSTEDLTPSNNNIYLCKNALWMWNGEDLVPYYSNDCLNLELLGNETIIVNKKIALIQNHYYKISIPSFWDVTGLSGWLFFIETPSGTDVIDTTGKAIAYAPFALRQNWLFKASATGLFRIGIRAKANEVARIQVEDVTELVNYGHNGYKSLNDKLQIGSIINKAAIGQVPSLITDTDTMWRYGVFDVKEGEIYLIKGKGGTNAISWSVLNSNNQVIDYNDILYAQDTPLLIPNGAVKLTVCFHIATYPYSIGVYDNRQSLLLESLQHKLFDNIQLLRGSILCGGEIGSKPSLEIDADGGWRHVILNVKEGEIYHIKGKGGSSANYPAYVILGIDGRILYTTGGGDVSVNADITIPYGGAQLICNFNAGYPYSLEGVPTSVPKDIISLIDDGFSFSPFYKKVNYGIVPTDDYIGVGEDYSWGSASILTTDVYDKYDSLINTESDISDRAIDVNDGYIFRKKFGVACDNQPLVMYEFKPNLVSAADDDNPKIFIICGQHGFEKQSTFGMWYLLNDVVNHTEDSPVAKYIRQFVHLYVIPVANPSGWDAGTYVNGNGVNLNRNWYVDGWVKVTEPASQASGDAPFDQPETAAMRDLIDGLSNILLLMDCHQNGGGLVTYENINWIDVTKVDDAYFNKTLKASIYEVSAITRLFRNLYQSEIGGTNELCGIVGTPLPGTKGYADLWAIQQRNIIGITHEGFGGFPLGVYNNANSHKANSELLGNYIKNFLSYYSR